MLTLIIAESSLETIPNEILNHPKILAYARKLGKKPELILLDKSYHYDALNGLKGKERRGRPDIIHITLLEALGSPLNLEGLLQTYVHTLNNYIISINPKTRLPRNYNRFIGLIEQLFDKRRIPPEGEILLRLRRFSLRMLMEKLKPTHIVAFTSQGKPEPVLETAKKLSRSERPVALVGGFPHGHFSKQLLKLVDETVCIDPSSLDAWIATSRIISAYEEAIGLPGRRLGSSEPNSTARSPKGISPT
jgi:rRNA small subunit pseudouridine methyltransferase Nep1